MYAEIVPTDLQDELLALRDEISKSSFRIGDIALQIIQEQRSGVEMVYKAVGSFVGKSARTIREYTSVSAFYPRFIRDQYDVLAYDHFRVAMRMGDQWLEALDWAVNQTDEMNRPATVDAMLAKFAANNVTEIEVAYPEMDDEVMNVLRRLKNLLLDRRIKLPDYLLDKAVQIIDEIERVMEKVV